MSPTNLMARPVGRPKTITDMRAYKAMKAREYRARDKALSIPKPILPTPTKQDEGSNNE